MGSANYHDAVSFALDPQEDYEADLPLFIDTQDSAQSLNREQFTLLVRTLITGFQAQGLAQGDCVLLHTGNHILYTALFLAVIGAGGVYMGSNPHSSADELTHLIQLTHPRLIITEPSALTTVQDVASQASIPENHILLCDDPALTTAVIYTQTHTLLPTTPSSKPQNLTTLLTHPPTQNLPALTQEAASTKPAALYSTSGTTGLPKAAILTHANILAQHASLTAHQPPESNDNKRVKRLIPLPIFHLFSALFTHLFPLRYGHPVYIMREVFTVPLFLELVHRHQIQEVYLVPAMVHLLLQAAGRDEVGVREKLASVTYVGVAGAPIDAASMRSLRGVLNPQNASCGQIWGMTECGVVFWRGRDEGGIGGVIPGWEVELRDLGLGDEDEKIQGKRKIVTEAGHPGRLFVRGQGVFAGYLGRGREGVDTHGWFDTGDVAYFNAAREYFVVGRTKELIKVRGYQVSPAEIEAVLLKHPLIRDVAVTGIALDHTTEAPRAYVVRADGARFGSDEVYSFAQQRLASYKAIDGGVFFVEKIPRTVSGKIQRGKLASMNQKREALAGLLSKVMAGKPRS
ncbi:acetyl-CoA synthetase-like protein [Aspergillus homomorphus CBS 101889]|uniref:Acetyl-CoA synthetase-like protein n=1 Tax=Aspergillus homomorphus (strain CBS 101889) TaxID=1450537 RepID=A0A395HHH0_ASPHC|nr:acetyl-CoA synthetase-like protein [Aspergillus homomorphus CBS 101889]RAL07362.1 acetyl-CoA synthetase-like protein [Aspergillus homomorphus CBS 101889]